MLAVSLVTLGSPSQLTGGYLYHQRMAELAPRHGAEIRFVSFPTAPFPLGVWSGRRVRDETAGADVVAVDSIAAAVFAPVARSVVRQGRSLIAVAHQVPGGIDHGPVRSRVQAPLDLALYRHACLVIAASEDLAADLLRAGVAAARIVVVAPGCDPAPNPAGPAGPVGPPDLRDGRGAAFVSVGNWVARKGVVDLLDAFARLPFGAATLHLAGRVDVDPRYARRVRRRLDQPDLAGRVVVHGPVTRTGVAELLSRADAFVLPSVKEPYGTVYGEALAAGVPVVGWRAGNLPHLAEDGKEGVVLEPGDVDGLATALGRLAADEAYRGALRRGARERGRSLPTWSESAERFFGVLRQAAG